MWQGIFSLKQSLSVNDDSQNYYSQSTFSEINIMMISRNIKF